MKTKILFKTFIFFLLVYVCIIEKSTAESNLYKAYAVSHMDSIPPNHTIYLPQEVIDSSTHPNRPPNSNIKDTSKPIKKHKIYHKDY